MALFNDRPPSDMEDLVGHDSQLPEVASGEGIDTTRKLALAQSQVGLEIQGLLGSSSSGPPLANVVVTEAVKLWHVYWTLESVYADAFFNALNDRYREKRDQFRARIRWCLDRVTEAGIGLVYDPIPLALTPAVAPSAGTLVPGTYYVTMTWINADGEEGVPANPDNISIAVGSFSVTTGAAPPNAVGWNIYAGLSPETMVLQNQSQLALGTVWVQPTPLAISGRAPGNGQVPNYFKSVARVFLRG